MEVGSVVFLGFIWNLDVFVPLWYLFCLILSIIDVDNGVDCMKMRKYLMMGLMILPLIGFVVALLVLPHQIPVHYGVSGQVDRVGSVFEILVFVIAALVLGGIGAAILKYSEYGSRVWLFPFLGLLALNLVFVYFLFNTVLIVNAYQPVSLIRYGCLLLGLLMIFLGCIFHRSKLNSGHGLRTPWSLRNEAAWAISQRWSGVLFVIAGIGISVFAFVVVDSLQVLIVSLMGVVVCYLLCVAATWRAARRVRF